MECNSCNAERAFVMRNRHQEALKKSVMLGHASQTSGLIQNVHDKCQNLPDPDTFTFDTSQQGGYLTGQGHGGGNHSASLSIRNKQEITKSTRTADDNSCSQPAVDSAGDGSNSGSYNL